MMKQKKIPATAETIIRAEKIAAATMETNNFKGEFCDMTGYIEKDNVKGPVVNHGSNQSPANPIFDKKLDFLKDFSKWDDSTKMSLFQPLIVTAMVNTPTDIYTIKYEDLFKNAAILHGDINESMSQMRLRFGREYKESHYQLSRYAANYVCLIFHPIFSVGYDIEKAQIPNDIKNQIRQFVKENCLFDLGADLV